MRETDVRTEPAVTTAYSASGLGWRRGDRSITAIRDRQQLGTVHWAEANPSEGLDLAVELGPGHDPEVACALLDRALTELGDRGVPKVRLTLTAGEVQTPGLLQIARGQRPAADSAAVVAETEVHAAGQSALVDVRLRPRSARASSTEEGAVA